MNSTSELWRRVMSVNLNGPMLMCNSFLPLMRGRGWGRVISVASATVAIASPVSIAYRASKMGVIGFTRALSATLGDDGITINTVLPSLTRTAMAEDLPAAVVDASLGRQVIHRMAEPEDIAESVLILASEEAGWITGQTIMANGGLAQALARSSGRRLSDPLTLRLDVGLPQAVGLLDRATPTTTCFRQRRARTG